MTDFHRQMRKDYGLLDFVFDFAPNTNGDASKVDWLASGETISTKAVTVESGLTKTSDALVNTNTGVRVWLDATASDLGSYLVTCSIVTSDTREDARTLEIEVI